MAQAIAKTTARDWNDRGPAPRVPPGATHVIHEDQGDGRFRFTLRTDHGRWGEMYLQSGLFD